MKDLGDRGLTLERLLRFVKETDVLDRDRRLVGEARDELDLLWREWPDLVAAQRHHADRLAVTQDRYADQCAETELRLELDECRVDPRFRQRIFDLCRVAVQDRAADDVPAIRALHGEAELEILLRLIEPESCDRVVATVGLEAEDDGALRTAEPGRGLEDAVEDGSELERRSADEPEDVRGRGLALERRPRLVEQPRILDRDRRLIRECLQKLDLLVSEGPSFYAAQNDRAETHSFAKKRRSQRGPVLPAPGLVAAHRILRRFRLEVVDVHRSPLGDRSARYGSSIEGPRAIRWSEGGAHRPVMGDHADSPLIREHHEGVVRTAEARSVQRDGFQDRMRVRRRTRNRAKHFAQGGLPLQRLFRLVEEPSVLDGDRRLAGEGLEDVDLPFAERPHLVAASDDDAEERRTFDDRHAEDRPFILARQRGHELRAPIGVVLGIREDVDDLHGRLLEQHPSYDRGSFFDEPTLSRRLSR